MDRGQRSSLCYTHGHLWIVHPTSFQACTPSIWETDLGSLAQLQEPRALGLPIPSTLVPPPAEFCVDPILLSLVHSQMEDPLRLHQPNWDHPFVLGDTQVAHTLWSFLSPTLVVILGLLHTVLSPQSNSFLWHMTSIYFLKVILDPYTSHLCMSSSHTQVISSLVSLHQRSSASKKVLQQTHPSWILPSLHLSMNHTISKTLLPNLVQEW